MVEKRHDALGKLVRTEQLEATVEQVFIAGGDEPVWSVAEGNGPVDALDQALHKDRTVLGLEGVRSLVSLAYTFPSCLPDPGRLVVPTRPVVVRAAPTFPASPGSGCPQLQRAAATAHRRGPFIPSRSKQRLVAHEASNTPRGFHHHMGDLSLSRPVAQCFNGQRRRLERANSCSAWPCMPLMTRRATMSFL